MLARDVLPIAASASLFVITPIAAPPSSATLRLPILQSYGGLRLLDMEAVVTGDLPVVSRSVIAAASPTHEVFTKADMAVLDAVDRADVVDDLDYTGLFDYDDD